MSGLEGVLQVLTQFHSEGRDAFARRYGAPALDLVEELETMLTPRLSVYGPLWAQYKAQPRVMEAALKPVLQMVLDADAALSRQVDEIAQRLQALQTPGAPSVHTGGGAYVGGAVTVGGSFVGRDNIVITGDGNVVGSGNVVTVTKHSELDPAKVHALFEAWRQEVAQRPDLPPSVKEDVRAELGEVEAEIKKGEKADEGFLMRRLRSIGRMAPDILEVMLTTFANPVAGLGKVAQKIAQKAKEEAEGKG